MAPVKVTRQGLENGLRSLKARYGARWERALQADRGGEWERACLQAASRMLGRLQTGASVGEMLEEAYLADDAARTRCLLDLGCLQVAREAGDLRAAWRDRKLAGL